MIRRSGIPGPSGHHQARVKLEEHVQHSPGAHRGAHPDPPRLLVGCGADADRRPAFGSGADRLQYRVGALRGHERHQTALVGHLGRIESEHLARRPHGRWDGQHRLVDLDAHPRVAGDLVERRGQPAPGGIAQRVHRGAAGRDHRLDQAVQRARVGTQVGLESEALPRAEHRDAVRPDRTGQQHGVARGGRGRGRGDAGQAAADPRRHHEDAVGRAPSHHLRVAGDHRHPRRPGRRAGRRRHPAQVVDRETLLDHVRETQRHRHRGPHRQVVDRAVYRQGADVTAREEQRPHHVRVGAQRQFGAVDLDQRGVLERTGHRGVTQGRHQHLADQLGRQPAAGAVPQQHPLGLVVWHRAVGEQVAHLGPPVPPARQHIGHLGHRAVAAARQWHLQLRHRVLPAAW
jgi:hypothetical protein